MSLSIDKEPCRKAAEDAGVRRLAVVYHVKISDSNGYDRWLKESKDSFGCKTLFRVKMDPVAREGMLIDEIVIDEFPSIQAAFEFLSAFDETLDRVCAQHIILAIEPEPSVTFRLVKIISWFVRLFKGITDKGKPTATWKAQNIAVWPDESQMKVARAQDLDEPLFVYNLNKFKTVAEYKETSGRC